MAAAKQPVPHEYGPTTVGHGESQCIWCFGTNRENEALGLANYCPARDSRDPGFRPASLKPLSEWSDLHCIAYLVFVCETVAHLRGQERELLPICDRVNAWLGEQKK